MRYKHHGLSLCFKEANLALNAWSDGYALLLHQPYIASCHRQGHATTTAIAAAVASSAVDVAIAVATTVTSNGYRSYYPAAHNSGGFGSRGQRQWSQAMSRSGAQEGAANRVLGRLLCRRR